MSRFRFIAAEQATHSVAPLCRVLGVSRSGFYAWQRRPLAPGPSDAALTDRIGTIHADSRATNGAPRVHAALRAPGSAASASASPG